MDICICTECKSGTDDSENSNSIPQDTIDMRDHGNGNERCDIDRR